VLNAPKYGNDIPAVDDLAGDLYAFWAEETRRITTTYGGFHMPSSITIGTANWAGGQQTMATPDGRRSGDCLADEALSPIGDHAKRGPHAALRSALKVNQSEYLCIALDLKFSPNAFSSAEETTAVGAMIRDYFKNGGRHIQFNVVDNETLKLAQRQPERFGDLVVRIGGCSAYFAHLPQAVQSEIIQRTEFQSARSNA
jgi:formate C-acetyltransferase